MTVSTTSTTGSVNMKDVLKGLLLAVLTPVLTIIFQSLQAGNMVFDWEAIGGVALSAFLAYILKNFLSPGLVTIEAPKEVVRQVEDGQATATIVTK